jgi:hypothetical protein
MFNDLTGEFLEPILIFQKIQSFLHIEMHLTWQPARTMHWCHHRQPPLPIPNICPDRMNWRILVQLPPNQQIAIDHLGHHNLMNDLDPLFLATLTNSIAVLDVMPFTRASRRHPTIMGTLRRLSTQKSAANTLGINRLRLRCHRDSLPETLRERKS